MPLLDDTSVGRALIMGVPVLWLSNWRWDRQKGETDTYKGDQLRQQAVFRELFGCFSVLEGRFQVTVGGGGGRGETLSTWNYPRASKLHLVLPHELTQHCLTLKLVIQLNS